MTRGPLWRYLFCVSSMMGRPPMPDPMTTAIRSRLSSRDREPRVLHGELRRGHRVVDEGVHLLDLLLLDVERRIEALHFTRDPAGERGGVEPGDRTDPVLRPATHGVASFLRCRFPGARRARPPSRPRGAERKREAWVFSFCEEFFSMYSMASLTFWIFSAASSGISMLKASSNAMTSSTVSRESAPEIVHERSFGGHFVGVHAELLDDDALHLFFDSHSFPLLRDREAAGILDGKVTQTQNDRTPPYI